MRLWFIAAAALGLSSCAAAGGGAGLIAGALLLGLIASACGSTETRSLEADAATPAPDAGLPPDTGPSPDAGPPEVGAPDMGDGTWQTCCADGVIDSCFCPAGVACNYGWYTDCGDGTCVFPGEMCDE